jgi:hypothetical protein
MSSTMISQQWLTGPTSHLLILPLQCSGVEFVTSAHTVDLRADLLASHKTSDLGHDHPGYPARHHSP